MVNSAYVCVCVCVSRCFTCSEKNLEEILFHDCLKTLKVLYVARKKNRIFDHITAHGSCYVLEYDTNIE